jgi:autotransporter-associated beta strand protein
MKPKSTLLPLLALAGSSLLAISSASAQATSNTWDTDADGNWTDVLNWQGDTAYAEGADNTATLGNFITANSIITLDAPITIGNITASDTTHNYTVSGANTLTLDRTDAAAPTIDVTSGRTLTISSNIDGSDGLTKSGAGTLTLSGNNTYTGVTTHGSANGITIVASDNALGSTAAGSHTEITLSSTDFRYIGINNGVNTGENFTIFGSSGTGSTAIRGISGTATLSGTITMDGSGQTRLGGTSATLNWTGTITQVSSKSYGLVFYGNNTISNAMTINGGGLTAVSGTVTLNAVNPTDGTGLGDASTFGGSFRLGVTNALRTDGNISFAGGGSNLNLNGNNQTIKGLISTANTGYTVSNGAGSTTSTLTVGNGGGDYSFGGVISNGTGIVALVKTGAGNQTLTGINTFTGGTRIDDGTLTLGNSTNTLANAGTINVNGGTLALGTNTDTVGAVTLTSGNITGSGTASEGVLTGTSYDVRSGSVSAKLAGTGAALTKSTSGTVTLSAANTYSGATAITEGTLTITGPTQATNSITFTGGSLGLDTGFPVTASSAAVDLANGTIKVTGSTGAPSYTLLTAATITGPPVLAAPVSGYTLQVIDGATDELRLVQTGGGSAYDTWSGGAPFDGDANGDGVNNGLAFLLGAATPGTNATGLLPTTSQTGGNLVMNFTCLATADRGTATLTLEYDGDLAGTWLSVPVPGAVGAPIVENTATGSVSFEATDGGTNVNGDALIDVEATISDAAESASGKLFGRLKAVNP